MEWHLKRFEELSTNELYEILFERVAVFVVEQECYYPEVDGKDRQAYHLFLEDNGEVLAYARIIDAGVQFDEPAIGRGMIRTDHRGQGLARELLTRAITFIKETLQAPGIRIEAQYYLREFYQSLGFEITSEPFDEDGILHVQMALLFAES